MYPRSCDVLLSVGAFISPERSHVSLCKTVAEPTRAPETPELISGRYRITNTPRRRQRSPSLPSSVTTEVKLRQARRFWMVIALFKGRHAFKMVATAEPTSPDGQNTRELLRRLSDKRIFIAFRLVYLKPLFQHRIHPSQVAVHSPCRTQQIVWIVAYIKHRPAYWRVSSRHDIYFV